jgi:hypothetical protein
MKTIVYRSEAASSSRFSSRLTAVEINDFNANVVRLGHESESHRRKVSAEGRVAEMEKPEGTRT